MKLMKSATASSIIADVRALRKLHAAMRIRADILIIVPSTPAKTAKRAA
jgi:hypothetical protein